MKEFAVPFTGRYNTRINAAATISNTSGVIGFGVVGLFVIGGLPPQTNKDERYMNCFLMTTGDKKVIVKRPGFGVDSTPAAGNIGNAILVWAGSGDGTNRISAFGGTNSTLYNGLVSIGAITGRAQSISETFVGTVPTLVVPSSDNTGWYYDVGVGVMTKITDVNFPGNAGKVLTGGFAHMDGWAFIMDTLGNVWNSTLNTVTGWAALNFISHSSYPDKGIACIRYKNYIMAFGAQSIQFFQNSGNAVGTPLSRIENLTIRIGAITANSIAQISDVIFWVTGSAQGGLSVYKYEGGAQRISFPEQDRQLMLAGPNNISMTTAKFYGLSFVLINAGAATLVYCVELQSWHEWSGIVPLWFRCAGLSSGNNQVLTYGISNVLATGKIYVITPAALTFQDDGQSFTAIAQSAADDSGTTRRKSFPHFRIEADIEASTSPITVSYSDDDYATFTEGGTIDLAAPAYLTNLGATDPRYGNKRAWRLGHSANTPMRIQKAAGFMNVAER